MEYIFQEKLSLRQNMDELAYKSSNTRKANQFSWKIIHNTIYTEAKLKKK